MHQPGLDPMQQELAVHGLSGLDQLEVAGAQLERGGRHERIDLVQPAEVGDRADVGRAATQLLSASLRLDQLPARRSHRVAAIGRPLVPVPSTAPAPGWPLRAWMPKSVTPRMIG